MICLRGRREKREKSTKREEGGEKSKERVGRGGRGVGDIKSTERGGRWAREGGDGEGEKSEERAPSMTLHSQLHACHIDCNIDEVAGLLVSIPDLKQPPT